MILKWILLYYKSWSELKNHISQEITSFSRRSVTQYIYILGVSGFQLPYRVATHFLTGIPLKIGGPKKAQWRPMIDMIQKRLASWKGQLLSFVG